MTASPEAVAHQQQREQLAAATARAVTQQWSLVDSAALVASWGARIPAIAAMISAGQLTAGQQSVAFLAALLQIESALIPAALAGIAPDGRTLAGLLFSPVATALRVLGGGGSLAQAMASGAASLDMITRTVISDTGRQADQVGMVSNLAVTSYIRVVESPSCARCVILAGREYSVSTGFQRHPRCDCTMQPVTREHRPKPSSPAALFRSMGPAERKATFGEAGAKAIADGADISNVVNARKGMSTVNAHGHDIKVTYSGTGRGRRKKPPRLMPEEIYKQADDREHAIRLLRKNGFISG